MGADRNSSQRRWELQQDEHSLQNTSPTQLPKLAKTTQPLECYQSQEPATTYTYSRTQRNKQLEHHYTTPVRPVSSIGQTGPCWSTLAKPKNFHKRPLHLSGRCSSTVRPVQARKSQIYQTDLPSSKLTKLETVATQDNMEFTKTFT
jgi:hypothetical protein